MKVSPPVFDLPLPRTCTAALVFVWRPRIGRFSFPSVNIKLLMKGFFSLSISYLGIDCVNISYPTVFLPYSICFCL